MIFKFSNQESREGKRVHRRDADAGDRDGRGPHSFVETV